MKANILVGIFLHDAFSVGVRQIIPRIILHTTLNIYPNSTFMNEGLWTDQKIYVCCDSLWYIWYSINVVVTHNKIFGSLSRFVNEVCMHIVLVADNIIVFLYQILYNILCLLLSFWFPPCFIWNNCVAIVYTLNYL